MFKDFISKIEFKNEKEDIKKTIYPRHYNYLMDLNVIMEWVCLIIALCSIWTMIRVITKSAIVTKVKFLNQK